LRASFILPGIREIRAKRNILRKLCLQLKREIERKSSISAPKSKIRVGILFGGKSAEHEVSLQSAQHIINAIDRDKYEVVLIGIDKEGRWHLNETSHYLLHAEDPRQIQLEQNRSHLALVPGNKTHQLIDVAANTAASKVDVIFPILHGPYGEDGSIQGLLKWANVPFVGASVLGSAVGMDKDVMKRLLRDAGIRTARFLAYTRGESDQIRYEKIISQLGIPFFVKPANLGSSVGIHRVIDKNGFVLAVEDAFLYDTKVIFEEAIKGRELEISVLGNDNPIVSLPGEIIPNASQHQFYSYDAKYIDDQGATLQIPAELPEHIVTEIQRLALHAYRTLCCEGMARIDFFLTEREELIVNELNTIPGFTNISMYPKLWEASGISGTELIDRLIQLAIELFEVEQELHTSYSK